jgi:uncharacterized protein YbjT (DUF2867 family)
VERVLVIVRAPTGQRHDKLREIVHADLFDLSAIEPELAGHDACFFCLGVSAAGMKPAEYERVTYDLTLAVARTLARINPAMTFVYVSGAGTDGSERGRSMWARVKGKTENPLLRLPFKAAYMFRPGFVQPRHGIVSKTRLYRVVYSLVGWMYPVWKVLFPSFVTTTEQVGRAMLAVAKKGAAAAVLENRDINAAAA